MTRLRSLSLGLILGASLTLAGCGGNDDGGVAAPPAPATQAQGVNLAAAPAAAPEAATPQAPPPAGVAPTAIVPAPELKDSDILGGNGRPLTDEEKMLLNYGVDMFKEEKGRFPANLQEAVASRHITRLPKLPPDEQMNYDPQTGRVTITKKAAAQ
jgi:hypothetical protein